MWDLKQRNFFCVRLRPHSLWTQAGKRSTLGCGCRDSLYTGLGAALLSLPMSLSSGSRHRGGERVTYLDLLNSFHQWQKSNYLPGNARLLYYGLLAVFNEARWPEQVQIDNFRLMSIHDDFRHKGAEQFRGQFRHVGELSGLGDEVLGVGHATA